MAIYQYGDFIIPEIPASDLPYVHIGKNGTGWNAFFSSEPFVALEAMSSTVSLLGHYGYMTMACIPEYAQFEVYEFFEEKGKGWVKVSHDGSGNNGNSGDTIGGETGVFYYYASGLSQTSWCNTNIYYKGTTLVPINYDDPVLVKESFPIQEFTTYLMTAWQACKSMPFVESGGDS